MRRLDGIHSFGVVLLSARVRRVGFLCLLMAMIIGMALGGALPNLTQGETGAASATRLWSSGAELQSLTANVEVTGTNGSGATINTTLATVRSGLASYRTQLASNGTTNIYKDWANSAQQGKFWFRTYFRVATAPTVEEPFFCLQNGGNFKTCVRLTTDLKLKLGNEEDLTTTSAGSTTLSTGTWYRLELYMDTTTLSSTVNTLRVNGVQEHNETYNFNAGIDRLIFGIIATGQGDFYYDDLAINNSTGRADNWPGEGKIVHMQPNATGDNEQWDNTTEPGSPTDCDAAGDPNWQCVEEITPDDITTYAATQTNNEIDDYNLESASNAGIGSGDYIKLVSVGVRFRPCGTTSEFSPACLGSETEIGMAVRLKAVASGTTEEVTSNISDGSPWLTNDDDTARLNKITQYDLPGSSTAPWTTTDLDSAQVGIKNLDSTGTGFRASTIWLQVEYVPKSGGRIFSSGYELNSTVADEEWSSFGGSVAIQNGTPRSGTYAADFQETAGTDEYSQYNFSTTNQNGPYFARSYVYFNVLPEQDGDEVVVLAFRDTSNNNRAWLSVDYRGQVHQYDEDGLIATAAASIAAGTWYRFELKIDVNGTAGTHDVEGRVDGTTIQNATAQSISTGVGRLAVGLFYATAPICGEGGGCNAQLYADDVAVNQDIADAGAVQDSWPGSGKIFHLRPSATGDGSETWTSAGDLSEAACDASGDPNWQCLDEVTPDEAVSLIEETTSLDTEDFNLTDSSISSLDTVTLVSVGARFRTSSATQEDFRVRLKENSTANNAVPIESDLLSPASTTWVTNRTAAPYQYPLTAYTRPEQSSSWTDTQLDTAQIGVRDISGSGTVQVSTMWLLVEYIPDIPDISGTIYQTDESTVLNCSSGGVRTVRVKVNGAGDYTGDCTTSGGTYTVANVSMIAGDALTVYLDGETEKAATFTVSTGATMTGIDLYQDRAATRCDNSCSLTSGNISNWDKSHDTDIHADHTGSAFVVDNDWKLLVKANTFAPGVTTTTSAGGSNSYSGDLTIASGATLSMAGNALNVGGSFDNDGTFNKNSGQTTTLTSRKTDETLSDGSSGNFENLEIDNGLVGYWKFDEGGSSTTAYDSSGDGKNGTNTLFPSNPYVSPNNTSHYHNNPGALDFDGVDSYVDLPDGFADFTGGATFAFWMYPTSTAAWQRVFDIAQGQADDNILVNRRSNTQDLAFEVYVGGASQGVIYAAGAITQNTWQHFAVTLDSNRNVSIYKNGVAQNLNGGGSTSLQISAMPANLTRDDNFIGRSNWGTDAYYDGYYDDMRIYNRPLASGEITSLKDGNHPSEGTYTLQDALDVNSNLGIRTGKLDVSSGNNYAITLAGDYRNVANFEPRSGTFTFDGTTTGKNLQSDPSFYDYSVSNSSGGVILNLQRFRATNNVSVTGTFDSSPSSCYGATATTSCNVVIGNNFTSSGSTYTLNMQAATWTVSGNWDTSSAGQDSARINEGTSTLVMDGTGTKTIKTGSTNVYEARFYNLNVGASAGKTTQMLQSYGVSNVLTLGAGTYDLNSFVHFVTGGTANPLSLNASGTWGTGTGGLYFYGGINMNLPAFTYNSSLRTEVNTGNKIIQQGTAIITGNLEFGCCSRASEYDTNSQTLTVNGNVTWNDANGIFTTGSSTVSVGGNWANSLAGTFNANTSTINFTSTTTGRTIHSGGRSFYNLTFNGSGGGWSFSAAGTVTNDLAMTAGTLSGTQNLTVNGNVAGTSGIINLTGGTFEQRVAAAKNFGTTSGSTAWYFNNLTFSNGCATLGCSLTVTTQTGGSGYVIVGGVLSIGKSGDANATTLNAGNRLWGLRGTSGTPLAILSSPQGVLTASTSRFMYAGNNTGGNTTVTNATYYNLDINDGLVGYWNLNEGTGTSAADVSGYDVTGTLASSTAQPTWSSTVPGSGYYGKNTASLDFDGGDHVTLSSTNDLPSGTAARTMCAWAKTDTTSANFRWIAAYGTNSNSQAMFIGLNGTTLYGGGFGNDITASSFWDTTNWKHICLVYDGANATLYGNGSVVAGPTAKTWNLVKNYAYLGSQVGPSASERWDGLVDDVRIYNRALSSTEITALSGGNNPAGNETYVLAANTTASNDLGIRSGTLDTVSGSNYQIDIGKNYHNYGTFTARSGLVNLTSTGKANLNGFMTGSSAFYNLTHNGVGGEWTFNAPVAAGNDYTVTNGSVDASNNNLTVTRDYTLANTSGVSYTAGSSTVTVSRHWTDSGGKFSAGTSTVTLNGTGTIATSNQFVFNILNVAYSTFTTTITDFLTIRPTALTLNGGTLTGSGTLVQFLNSGTSTPVTFNAATTLSGSGNIMGFQPSGTSSTMNVTGGNYGTWRIAMRPGANTQTINFSGGVTTTGSTILDSCGATGGTFNTQNNSLTTSFFQFGDGACNTNVSSNFGSSAITLTTLGNTFFPGGSSGSYSVDLGSSTIDSKGSVLFVNGSASLSITPGTSTVKWTHTSGTPSFAPNGQSLYNMELNSTSGTLTPTGAVDVNNNFTITAGTYDVVNGSNYGLTIGNNYSNSGTFTARAGTVTFDATDSGNTLSGTLNGTSAFYNLTFNGSGGGWSNSSAMLVTNDLTMTAGTLSGTNDVTVNSSAVGTGGILSFTGGTFEQRVAADKNFGTSSGTVAWTFNDLTFSNSHASSPFTITTQTGGTGGITVSSILRVGKSGDNAGATTTLNAGNRVWTLGGSGGDPFQLLASPAASFTANTSTFTFTGTNSGGNTTIQATTYCHLNIGQGGLASDTYVLEGATTTDDTGSCGDLTIVNSTGGTNTLDVVSGQNYALTIGGDYSNNDAFTAQNGTVTFDDTATGNTLSGTLNGSSAFYNLVFNGVGGGWTFNAAVAVTNDFTVTNGAVTANGNNLTVTRDFTLANTTGVSYTAGSTTITVSRHWTDSGGKFVRGTSTVTLDGTGTIIAAAEFTNLNMAYSSQTTTISTNNVSTRAGIITLNGGTLTSTGREVAARPTSTSTPVVFNAPTTLSGSGNTFIYQNESSSITITTAGADYGTWNISFRFGANNGTFNFGGNITTTGQVDYFSCGPTGGVVNTHSNALTASAFRLGWSSCTTTVTVNFGSSTVTLSATGNALYVDGGAQNLDMGSATVDVKGHVLFKNGTHTVSVTGGTSTLTMSGTGQQTLNGNSQSLYNLTVTNASGINPSDCERASFVPGIKFTENLTVSNNLTIATASVRAEFTNSKTFTFANINWNGQASGTRVYFRNSTDTGGSKWNLNVSGTQTAVSYVNVSRSDASGGNTIGAHNGTNVDCGNNVNWSFATPNNAASLAQKRTNDVTLGVGDWTNETSVKFTANISDGDNPASIQLCVEKDLITVAFSNTEDSCGSLVAYSGSAVAASVTISGLTANEQYHWQARVKDSGGGYSSWVAFGGNSDGDPADRDFGVDTTACTYAGSIYDGTTEDVDASYNTGTLDTLSANWDDFSCDVSGLLTYLVSVGTTAGGTQILDWINEGSTPAVTAGSLNLHTNQRYYINVKAVDNAQNESTVYSSNGQDVLPSISFSLGATTITFANLNDNNNRSDTKTLTLTTSTNAYGGFVIRQYASGLLQALGGEEATTIPMFEGGSYASPGAWPSGFCTSGSNCGYGYTSSDTTIQGSNKFNNATLYAPFATSAFGDIVADHTAAVTGSTGAVVNEQHTITHKVAVDALQIANTYQTEVLYIVTGTF